MSFVLVEGSQVRQSNIGMQCQTSFVLCCFAEQSESASIRDEELQGLRQQHALLKKMLEQQQQVQL